MGRLFRMQRSTCPICQAELGPDRFDLARIWSMNPYTFRCPSCATMLKWSGRRLALPFVWVWALFFAPPAFLQSCHGPWTYSDYLRKYFAMSWSIGGCILLAIYFRCPKDAEKFSDE